MYVTSWRVHSLKSLRCLYEHVPLRRDRCSREEIPKFAKVAMTNEKNKCENQQRSNKKFHHYVGFCNESQSLSDVNFFFLIKIAKWLMFQIQTRNLFKDLRERHWTSRKENRVQSSSRPCDSSQSHLEYSLHNEQFRTRWKIHSSTTRSSNVSWYLFYAVPLGFLGGQFVQCTFSHSVTVITT